MKIDQKLRYKSNLSAVVIRKDGRRDDLGILKMPPWYKTAHGWICALFLAVGAGLFLKGLHDGSFLMWLAGAFGIVTTTGANYMASDFASGGATPTISGFKYHDCGTGTIAAAVGDTGLGTPAGTSRVVGTPTNPAANQYRSVATIAFTGALAITEWGLFSASTSGTLWDRRVFGVITVANGDSIQFTYTLSINSGGT